MNRKYLNIRGLSKFTKYLSIFFVVSCSFQTEKDKWLEEPIEVRFSRTKEREIWGKVLQGKDAEIFYGTPSYEAAKLIVENKNKDLLKQLNKLSKKDINYQEPKFNGTLGHLALMSRNIEAVDFLLDKGINPNLIAKGGSSIMTFINSANFNDEPKSIEILKKAIEKGGNVNLLYKGKSGSFRTPLITASSSSLTKTKILIKAGANPNFLYEDEPNELFPESPFLSALLHKRIDIVNYFVFEVDIDYKKLKYPSESKYYPRGYRILGGLRKMTFPLDSNKYKQKMKLIDFLYKQGVDYSNSPIPRSVREFPGRTEEYLSKY